MPTVSSLRTISMDNSISHHKVIDSTLRIHIHSDSDSKPDSKWSECRSKQNPMANLKIAAWNSSHLDTFHSNQIPLSDAVQHIPYSVHIPTNFRWLQSLSITPSLLFLTEFSWYWIHRVSDSVSSVPSENAMNLLHCTFYHLRIDKIFRFESVWN